MSDQTKPDVPTEALEAAAELYGETEVERLVRFAYDRGVAAGRAQVVAHRRQHLARAYRTVADRIQPMASVQVAREWLLRTAQSFDEAAEEALAEGSGIHTQEAP